MSGRHPAPPPAARTLSHPNYTRIKARMGSLEEPEPALEFHFLLPSHISHFFFPAYGFGSGLNLLGFINTLPIEWCRFPSDHTSEQPRSPRVNELQHSLKKKKKESATPTLFNRRQKKKKKRQQTAFYHPRGTVDVIYLLKFPLLVIDRCSDLLPPATQSKWHHPASRSAINHTGCISASLPTIRWSVVSFSPKTEPRRHHI